MKGRIATAGLIAVYMMAAYSVFILGNNGVLYAFVVTVTGILASIAGYKLKQKIDNTLAVLQAWSRLNP